jgi:hypothetical protein
MKRKKWERSSPRFHFCWVIDVNELPQRKRGLYPAPPPSLLLTTILYFIAHSGIRIRNLSKKVKNTFKKFFQSTSHTDAGNRDIQVIRSIIEIDKEEIVYHF